MSQSGGVVVESSQGRLPGCQSVGREGRRCALTALSLPGEELFVHLPFSPVGGREVVRTHLPSPPGSSITVPGFPHM